MELCRQVAARAPNGRLQKLRSFTAAARLIAVGLKLKIGISVSQTLRNRSLILAADASWASVPRVGKVRIRQLADLAGYLGQSQRATAGTKCHC
jgi:hypothetical protein